VVPAFAALGVEVAEVAEVPRTPEPAAPVVRPGVVADAGSGVAGVIPTGIGLAEAVPTEVVEVVVVLEVPFFVFLTFGVGLGFGVLVTAEVVVDDVFAAETVSKGWVPESSEPAGP
jgi:hypothetical protein